jgi:hypothetical protein
MHLKFSRDARVRLRFFFSSFPQAAEHLSKATRSMDAGECYVQVPSIARCCPNKRGPGLEGRDADAELGAKLGRADAWRRLGLKVTRARGGCHSLSGELVGLTSGVVVSWARRSPIKLFGGTRGRLRSAPPSRTFGAVPVDSLRHGQTAGKAPALFVICFADFCWAPNPLSARPTSLRPFPLAGTSGPSPPLQRPSPVPR